MLICLEQKTAQTAFHKEKISLAFWCFNTVVWHPLPKSITHSLTIPPMRSCLKKYLLHGSVNERCRAAIEWTNHLSSPVFIQT